VEKEIVRLNAALRSFEQAVQTYERLTGVGISDTSGWRRVQEYGQRLVKVRQEEAKGVWEAMGRGECVPGEESEAVQRGVALDGTMVHIREEGWKEVKIGCVFEFEVEPGAINSQEDEEEKVRAKNLSYCAWLGGVEDFAKQQWAEAVRRGMPRSRDQVVLGDGAPWIWNLADDCYPDSVRIVDWYHAMEHLWSGANAVYGPETAAARRWVKRREEQLALGEVHKIIAALEQLAEVELVEVKGEGAIGSELQRDLEREANYFRTNKRRMHYQDFREEGYPIGSGMVESGCKNVVGARLKGPGMRWSRTGAERMLALRSELLSDRWDEAWELMAA
jgi:hypothetical protein